jgi:hypothetical protein
LDWLLILMFTLSTLVYWGGAIALVWSARAAFAHARPLLARVWSVALALSGLVFLWLAYTYHLMHFTTHY